MDTLDKLQPRSVFSYFKEISSIPHGSGNTKAISDYCVEFARKHGLWYKQDKNNNVIIRKPATVGRENAPGVIIQGHLDMVTVKEPNVWIDFENDPLDLQIDGDFLYAKGTSLGGDDGIAVAYALALLESDTIQHPCLEVIFTVDEEIGLIGAKALDMSDITGKYLLNIDSEEEGILLVSCAGGLTGNISLPVKRTACEGTLVRLSVDGLLGGHSGVEIDKERCNAIYLIGRLLFDLHQQFDFKLMTLNGGEKDNAIAKYCQAELLLDDANVNAFSEAVDIYEKIYSNEYRTSDSGLKLVFDIDGYYSNIMCVDGIGLEKVLFMLRQLPYGVMHHSVEIEGLVETSANMGIVRLLQEDRNFNVTVSLRSSEQSRKQELSDKICYLVEFLGGTYEVFGEYPAWPNRTDSRLRPQMARIYKELFDETLRIEAIHAGLECGILLEKRPELDAVSFGPNIYDIHTTKERMSISSVERIWRYLITVIENII